MGKGILVLHNRKIVLATLAKNMAEDYHTALNYSKNLGLRLSIPICSKLMYPVLYHPLLSSSSLWQTHYPDTEKQLSQYCKALHIKGKKKSDPIGFCTRRPAHIKNEQPQKRNLMHLMNLKSEHKAGEHSLMLHC